MWRPIDNAQPMGFYAPAQIVTDARRHGAEIRPISFNDSHWYCTLEPSNGRHKAVRLGVRMVRGLANVHGAAIVGAKGPTPCGIVEEVQRRAGAPRAAIERLSKANAFHCITESRHQGLWKVKGLGDAPLPLFAATDAREAQFPPKGLEPSVALRPMCDGREVIEDYRTFQPSLRGYTNLRTLPARVCASSRSRPRSCCEPHLGRSRLSGPENRRIPYLMGAAGLRALGFPDDDVSDVGSEIRRRDAERLTT